MLPSKFAKIVKRAVAQNELLFKKGSSAAAAHVLSLQKQVRDTLVMSKGFQASHLAKIQAELKRLGVTFDKSLTSTVAANQDAAWKLGADAVANGFKSTVGIDLAMLPTELLIAAKDYAAELITDLSKELIEKISSDIRTGVVLGENPYETMQRVEKHLFKDGEGAFFRAETIVRTENNRIFGIAQQERLSQAAKDVPKLRKIWVASSDERTRDSHYQAGIDYAPGGDPGPIPVDQPFIVDGEELMFPGDPMGEARLVINCRCVSEPYVEDWEKDVVKVAAQESLKEGGPGSGRYPAGSGKEPSVKADSSEAVVQSSSKEARVTVRNFAKLHRYDVKETAHAVGKDGAVLFSKTGTESAIDFTAEEFDGIYAARPEVFVHNHPTDTSPFSDADLIFACTIQPEEMVVISKKMDFSIRPDPEQGWPFKGELQRAIDQDWNATLQAKVFGLQLAGKPEDEIKAAYDDARRELLKTISPKLGLKYVEVAHGS